MAQRSVSRPIPTSPPAKKPSRPAMVAVESEEPRPRFAGGADTSSIFKDPVWADQADALVNAIFIRGHLKRVAEAVAGDIATQIKAGKTLAEIAITVPSKTEEQRSAYRVGLDESPRIFKSRLKEPPFAKLRDAMDAARSAAGDADGDEILMGWTKKLLADQEAWQRKRRS